MLGLGLVPALLCAQTPTHEGPHPPEKEGTGTKAAAGFTSPRGIYQRGQGQPCREAAAQPKWQQGLGCGVLQRCESRCKELLQAVGPLHAPAGAVSGDAVLPLP